tara:strand:- start:728 stop:892 length:165 start_codon:yes stop_codon:yes gene_type:complete
MKLWRWSLYTRHYAPAGKDYFSETGQEPEVRDAMNHVADVVEKLVKEKNEKCLN